MYSLCILGSVSCLWDPLGVPQSPALRSLLGVLAELVTHLRHTAMALMRKENFIIIDKIASYQFDTVKCCRGFNNVTF